MRETGGSKSSECEMFCVLSFLQLLDYAPRSYSLKTFDVLYEAFVTSGPSCNGCRRELFNFLRLLYNAVTLRDAKLFEHLLQVYKPHLDVDPNFHNYLGQIGHIFFGIQSTKTRVIHSVAFSEIF
ncbi:hypothetical protein KIN20_019036 [Parelaphostrongylus tenuis]|uniref:Uncharacterized protein n=1 Tax=Parelaphostrongylus tenuis TaxID=148309 RepID=A0AAD5QUT6_PARTN|nr:hypothetical protein KIN20_019036 [Parelaphostrongylus tenuis]